MGKGIHRVRQRRLLGSTTVVASVSAIVMLLASAAFARDGYISNNGYANCSKTWNYNPYGASAHAYFTSYGNFYSGSITLSSEKSGVDRMVDCGPGGYAVAAYKISITHNYVITGTSLTSCSAGIPVGFSCTYSTSTQWNFSETQSCGYNLTSCAVAGGPFYFYSHGGNFNNFYQKDHVTLYRNDGASYPFDTPQSAVVNF